MKRKLSVAEKRMMEEKFEIDAQNPLDDTGLEDEGAERMDIRSASKTKLEKKELPTLKEDEISELKKVIANLTEELKKREEELVGAEDRSLRAVAEADNFKKRLAKEKDEFQKYAAAPIVEAILPVIDNMEKALEAAKQGGSAEALVQGVELIHKQLMTVLSNHGLSRLEVVGKPMDPNTTEAISMLTTEESDDGVVLTEFIPGYTFKERVIRTAKVAVANNPEQPAAQGQDGDDADIGAVD